MKQDKQRTATLTLPVNNEHGIICFEDLLIELLRMYNVEKNAKNKAYLCILETIGHEKHVEWEKNHKTCENYHLECVKHLVEMNEGRL